MFFAFDYGIGSVINDVHAVALSEWIMGISAVISHITNYAVNDVNACQINFQFG